jgi:ribonuclease P protein component
MGSGCACALARGGRSSPAAAARAALGSRPDAPAVVLPSAARIRARTEFTTTVRSGVRASSPSVVVHLSAAESPATASPRVGFIVTRSVGSAVVRNRIRRRLRHMMRDRLDRLPRGAGLVVRVNPAAVGRSPGELVTDLDRALDRALRQVAAP